MRDLAAWMILVLASFVLLGLVFAYFSYANSLKKCQTEPSQYCFMISCPCNDDSKAPCYGYAQRKAEDGNFYCSNAPNTKVDKDGKVVS